MKIVLASASERRQALLRKMGYRFEVRPAEVCEDYPDGLPAEQVAELLAKRKAQAIAEQVSSAIVIGADTLVALGDEIIGKPRDREDARRILRRLRNTAQRVITGLCVIDTATGRTLTAHETSIVRTAFVPDKAIDRYVESGLGDDKAGAYAVQETNDPFVDRVVGSFTNVVGLPTELLGQLLKKFGVRPESCSD